MTKLIVATRESALALWQANHVASVLRERDPAVEVELLGMTTAGDLWLQTPLAEAGGKGLFIKELEAAMLAGAAQLAVHSMKDLPAELPAGFVLPVMAFRDDPRDVLVSPTGSTLAALPAGARIGSASLRRGALLRAQRPDLDVQPVRGNLQTRLAKLDQGEFDALILAAAGLKRLGLGARISEYLDTETFVPAPGQGALGIECRADDQTTRERLEPLNVPSEYACISAERAVSQGLGANCATPLGAFAQWQGDDLVLRSALASPDGQRVLRAEARGSNPQDLGREVVEALNRQGAAELL
jgi:hydroxymethylbilane synthase